MKIKCEVIAAETAGDSLRVTLQGKPDSAADWRRLERQEITIPYTDAACKAFYVGRKVVVTVDAP